MGCVFGIESDATGALGDIPTSAQTRNSQMAAGMRRAEEAFGRCLVFETRLVPHSPGVSCGVGYPSPYVHGIVQYAKYAHL